MNLRVIEFPPKKSTGMNLAAPGAGNVVPQNFGDVQFMRTWFEFDPGAYGPDARRGTNWYAMLGILLTLGVSFGFWAGLGWLITR